MYNASKAVKKHDFPYVHTSGKNNQKSAGIECKVYDNILQTIGNTPLVRLNRIPKEHGLKCEMYAKCEFMNPGGSVKDRVAYAMLNEAITTGAVKTDSRLIEPTSGNMGIGIALATAVYGYDCTIVTPDKNSDEKMDTQRLLGADVVQTPSIVPWEDPRSYLSVTNQMIEENDNAISLNQYENEANPAVHYEQTAEEILSALDRVDMLVLGIGTGGTISGVGHKIKEKCPDCIIVGVDPSGSTIYTDTNDIYLPFKVEGIGGDFVPSVLDKGIVDKVIKTKDKESFLMSRKIIRLEGLLCGGSSGSAMCAAIAAAKDFNLGPGMKCVVLLADGIRNYMTKFVSDQWMEAHLFKEIPKLSWPWWNSPVSNLKMNQEIPVLNENQSCLDVLSAMGNKHSVAIIVSDDGNFQGAITKDSLRNETTKANANKFNFNHKAGMHLMKHCYNLILIEDNPTIGLVSRVLDITSFVVMLEKRKTEQQNAIEVFIPRGIITSDIILNYIVDFDLNERISTCSI